MYPSELDCYIHFLETEGYNFCEGGVFNQDKAYNDFEDHVRTTNGGLYYLDYEECVR